VCRESFQHCSVRIPSKSPTWKRESVLLHAEGRKICLIRLMLIITIWNLPALAQSDLISMRTVRALKGLARRSFGLRVVSHRCPSPFRQHIFPEYGGTMSTCSPPYNANPACVWNSKIESCKGPERAYETSEVTGLPADEPSMW